MDDMTNYRCSARAVRVLELIACLAAIGCAADNTSSPTSTGTAPQRVAGAPSAGSAGQNAGSAGHAGAVGGPIPGLGMLMTTPPPPSAGSPAIGGAAGALASAGHAGVGALATGSAGQAGAAVSGSAGVGMTTGAAGNAAPAAGAGAAGGGAAPSDGMDPTVVCMGGKTGMDSSAAMPRGTMDGRNFAFAQYLVKAPNKIVRFQTILTAPKVPAQKSTLFIWPGLQHSGGADPARIGNGVLQPVLTWGPSCNTKASSKGNYMGWWISAMYVNISSGAAGPGGCKGGDPMDVAVGDRMYIDFTVKDTMWTQTVTNLANMKKVDLTTDLKGQDQTWAIWDIEVPASSRPSEDTIFEKSVLTFSSPVTTCQPSSALLETFTAPVLSADGLNCCYEKIVLKAK